MLVMFRVGVRARFRSGWGWGLANLPQSGPVAQLHLNDQRLAVRPRLRPAATSAACTPAASAATAAATLSAAASASASAAAAAAAAAIPATALSLSRRVAVRRRRLGGAEVRGVITR